MKEEAADPVKHAIKLTDVRKKRLARLSKVKKALVKASKSDTLKPLQLVERVADQTGEPKPFVHSLLLEMLNRKDLELDPSLRLKVRRRRTQKTAP